MKNGFSLIEIMLTVALTAVILPAIVIVLSFSLRSAKEGEKYTKAYALSQEQMEGIYFLKGNTAWDWEVTPENTAEGEYYQPQEIEDNWQLGSKTTTPVETEGYTKKVEIKEVRRDVTGNISDDPWAIVDDYSRWISVYVAWKDNGLPVEVKIDSLVTKY